MAKPSLCHLLGALLCAIALLSGLQAEISAAEDKVEARNDEGIMELAQQQQQAPVEPLPMKAILADAPAKEVQADKPVDSEMDIKSMVAAALAKENEQPDKTVGEQAAADVEVAAAVAEAADGKQENMEFAINSEALKQPGMARLARHLQSFHNYQLRRVQSRAANHIQNEDDDEQDDGIVPEERAIRRRKRVRRRNFNNRLRRTNRRKNVSQHRHNVNRVQSVRRPSMKKSTYRRGSNSHSSGNKKSSKPKKSNKKRRRSGQKKSTTKESSKTKRSKKGRKSNRRQPAQASQLIVFVDGGAPIAEAA